MRALTIAAMVLLVAGVAQGAFTYTYGPGTWFYAKTLTGTQSALVNGGGGDSLTLIEWSYARIESTSPLGTAPMGGVWELNAAGYSELDVLGGEIKELDIGQYGRAWLYGGRIDILQSTQYVSSPGDRHIDLFCKAGYSYDGTFLTGIWGDGSSFNMRLLNVSGYTPTFDNINFHIVPEPATMILLGLGGVICAASRRLRA